jgi:biopolymer transport protein ExbD
MPIQVPSPNARKHARIEIIPLIDIVFFLLATFVMVSLSMIQNKGIQVNLPVAASGTPQERKDITTISITATGEVFFNKQNIGLEGLEGALKDLKATNPEPRVFINGDAKAEYGVAVQVLDKVRRLGIGKVAIETRPQAGGSAAPAAPSTDPAAPAAPGTPAAPAPTVPLAAPAVPPAAAPVAPPPAALTPPAR